MKRRAACTLVAGVVMGCWAGGVLAQENSQDLGQRAGEYARERPGWEARELDNPTLPPLPDRDELLEVAVSDASRNQYFVDPASLSVGADSVTRMTIVVRHRNGRETMTYEGIRCETAEYRLYGISGGERWDEPKSSPWRPLSLGGYANVRGVLYKDFLCDARYPKDAETVVKHLRYPPVQANNF